MTRKRGVRGTSRETRGDARTSPHPRVGVGLSTDLPRAPPSRGAGWPRSPLSQDQRRRPEPLRAGRVVAAARARCGRRPETSRAQPRVPTASGSRGVRRVSLHRWRLLGALAGLRERRHLQPPLRGQPGRQRTMAGGRPFRPFKEGDTTQPYCCTGPHPGGKPRAPVVMGRRGPWPPRTRWVP